MALVVLNEKKYNAIKQYVKINVKDKSGRETIANIYRRIGISRTAFAKILSGETKRVKPETWFEIEKLLGDILESEESTLYSFTVEDCIYERYYIK
jgi:DNA transposition AAA+ family ATPase